MEVAGNGTGREINLTGSPTSPYTIQMGRDPHRVGIGAMVPKSTPPRTSLERFLEPLPRTSSSHLFLVLNLRRILRGLKVIHT